MTNDEMREWIEARKRSEARRAAFMRSVARVAVLPLVLVAFFALAIPAARAGGIDPLLKPQVLKILRDLSIIESDGTNAAVIGPASSTDNAIARFDGTTGELVQNSSVTIADTTGQISWGTGGGAIVHVLSPSDQNLNIYAQSTRAIGFGNQSGSATLFTVGATGGTSNATSSGMTTTNGTAALPSYAFAADTDTGAQRLAANQYAISTGGLTRKVYGGSVTITDNVATTVCTIALASGERVGGTVTYSIDVTDGTDHQVRSGSFDFAAVDKAGALTSQITENDTQAVADSAGTLTDAWTVSDGSNAISLQLTADSSLTPSSMIVRFEVSLFGSAATITVP